MSMDYDTWKLGGCDTNMLSPPKGQSCGAEFKDRRKRLAAAKGKTVECPSCKNNHYVAYCTACGGEGFVKP